jgi:hypothetical protein
MKNEDLPARWISRLEAHLAQTGQDRQRLSAYDFQHDLKLVFEDGSFIFFKYAFCLEDETLKELAVFTEHCGYHVFPLEGTEVEELLPRTMDSN